MTMALVPALPICRHHWLQQPCLLKVEIKLKPTMPVAAPEAQMG